MGFWFFLPDHMKGLQKLCLLARALGPHATHKWPLNLRELCPQPPSQQSYKIVTTVPQPFWRASQPATAPKPCWELWGGARPGLQFPLTLVCLSTSMGVCPWLSLPRFLCISIHPFLCLWVCYYLSVSAFPFLSYSPSISIFLLLPLFLFVVSLFLCIQSLCPISPDFFPEYVALVFCLTGSSVHFLPFFPT